jgi:hypothetical protein
MTSISVYGSKETFRTYVVDLSPVRYGFPVGIHRQRILRQDLHLINCLGLAFVLPTPRFCLPAREKTSRFHRQETKLDKASCSSGGSDFGTGPLIHFENSTKDPTSTASVTDLFKWSLRTLHKLLICDCPGTTVEPRLALHRHIYFVFARVRLPLLRWHSTVTFTQRCVPSRVGNRIPKPVL